MTWSSAEANLWHAVSESISDLMNSPPLLRHHHSVINLTEWGDKLEEIKIQWTAWHDLCSLNTHAKQALGDSGTIKGFIRKPANWTTDDYNRYLLIFWRLLLLTSGYQFQRQEFEKST